MKKLPRKTVEQIRAARAAGVGWKQIQMRWNISYQRARSAIDDDYRNICQESDRKRKADAEAASCPPEPPSPPRQDRIDALRSWQDGARPRDLTGLLMGDPPVGRSALDRKGAQ